MAPRQRFLGGRQVQGQRQRFTGDRTVVGERTRFTGTAAPPPPEHHGGGILHAIEHVVHVAGEKAALAGHDLKAAPGGAIDFVNAGAVQPWKDFLTTGHVSKKTSSNIDKLINEQSDSIEHTINHPFEDPFATALLAAPVLHGAGRVAERGVEAGRAAKAGEGVKGVVQAATRTPELRQRLLRSGDREVPLHASKSPVVRLAQQLHDSIVQKAIDTNPEGRVAAHGQKLIGGSLSETARYQQRMREVPANLLDHAAKRLAPSGGKVPGSTLNRLQRVEQAALELVSANTPPARAIAYHLNQAANGVEPIRNKAIAELYKRVANQKMLHVDEHGDVTVNGADHPKLAAADTALERVQHGGDAILADHGVRSAEQLQSRNDAPGQIRAGAKYVAPTPGRLGKVSQLLKRERQRLASLERRHGDALAKDAAAHAQRQAGIARLTETGPVTRTVHTQLTEDAARARLDELDGQYEAMLKKIAPEVNPYSPELAAAETRSRNTMRGRMAQGKKPATGRAIEGRVGGGNSKIKTISQEVRDLAESKLHDVIAKHPDNPVAQRAARLVAERDELRSILNQRAEHAFDGEPDYRGRHESPGPDNGAPMHDVVHSAEGGIYPEDFYSADGPRYYGTGYPEADRESFTVANRVRGNPDAEVTVYRAVPQSVDKINPGDWVTASRTYAKTHGDSNVSEGYKILSRKVRAGDLYTEGNSVNEWGWHPSGPPELPSVTATVEDGIAPVNVGGPSLPLDNAYRERIVQLGHAIEEQRARVDRMEKQAAARVEPTGIVGGEHARPGRGFVSYKTEEPKAPRSPAASSTGAVVGEAKPPIGSKSFTGAGIEKGLVPENVTAQAARHYRQLVRFVNTDSFRRAALETGSTTRRSSRDVLVRVPGETAAKIPVEIEQALGRKQITVDDVHGIQAALEAHLEDMIPGRGDRFAGDRSSAIGAAAPDGYRWVDRGALGELAKPGPGPRGRIARGIDNVNSAITAATVYFKIGHVGTRVFTNAATNIVQGSATPLQIAKSVELWRTLSHEDRLRALAAAGQHGFNAMPHEGSSLASKVATTGANWWARHADLPFRFNAIAYEARKAGFDTPERFQYMLGKLEDGGQGLNAAEAAKIDWVAKRANRAQIAYDRLNDFERRYITRAVWFYPWVKGASMFAGHTLTEHPFKAAAVGLAGQEGRDAQARELGDLPSYEGGLFRVAKAGADGMPLVADFSTFSPFATPADMLELPEYSQAADQLNPALGALLHLATRTNQYGQHSNSPLVDAARALVAPTSEAQTLEAFFGRHADQSNRMFPKSHDWAGTRDPILRALIGPGLPRKINLAAAAKSATRERAGR